MNITFNFSLLSFLLLLQGNWLRPNILGLRMDPSISLTGQKVTVTVTTSNNPAEVRLSLACQSRYQPPTSKNYFVFDCSLLRPEPSVTVTASNLWGQASKTFPITVFPIWANFMAMHSSKCLDRDIHGTASTGLSNGDPVVQWDCRTRLSTQQWAISDAGEGFYTLTSSGKCLDVSGGNRENGNPIIVWDCSFRDNQKWRIQPYLWYAQAGFFVLKSKQTEKCLDVTAESHDNGARVVQYDCHGRANQQWQLLQVSREDFESTPHP
jgi:hypothetical protein